MNPTRLAILLVVLHCVPLPCVRTLAAGPHVEADVLAFTLPDLDGNLVSHEDERFRGRVVFVTLWGTWCPPCISEIPTLNDLQSRYGDDGLVIVAIAFAHRGDAAERREELQRFVDEHSVGYLVLDGGSTSDAGTALPSIRDVKGLPVEISVGRDGLVEDTRNGYGYSAKWARTLEASIVRMLKAPIPD